MANTFDFIGRLGIGKESDTFKPFEQKTSESGWTNTTLKFNVIAGDNRHFLEVKGIHKADGNGIVYTFTKGGVDSDTGEKVKGESLQVAWKDRMKPEIIEQAAEFKKFVIDIEEPKRRALLEKAVEKFKDGSLTDEELLELNVEDPVKALEDSKKKRKEFIHETDFAMFLHKLISSGKYADRMFNVKGEIIYTEYNGKFYKHLQPTRVYLNQEDAKPKSEGNIVLFYKKNCVAESNGKVHISGYVRNYDNKRKEEISAPVVITVDREKEKDNEKQAKLHNLLISQFTVKDKKYYELGVKLTMLNGSQKVEITDDMLTDFQKEMIELGCLTLDEVRLELGGDLYGKPVEAMIVENVSRGYSKGRKDTLYEDKNFIIKELEIKKTENTKGKEADEEEDIFSSFMED